MKIAANLASMSKKKNSKRGFTQVGLPIEHHEALQSIADEEDSTRCGIIKRAIRPMILRKLKRK